MIRARVGVQQRYGDGLAPRRQHRIDGAVDGDLVERCRDRAVGIDAFEYLDDMAPLHERARLVDVEIISLVALLAANDEHIAEARGGDEAGGSTLALEDGIGGDRGGVQHGVDRTSSDARFLQQQLQPGDHGLARLAQCGRHLEGVHRPAGTIVQNEIGKGSADIEGQSDHAGPQPVSSWCVASSVRPTRATMSSISVSEMMSGGANARRSPMTRSTKPLSRPMRSTTLPALPGGAKAARVRLSLTSSTPAIMPTPFTSPTRGWSAKRCRPSSMRRPSRRDRALMSSSS